MPERPESEKRLVVMSEHEADRLRVIAATVRTKEDHPFWRAFAHDAGIADSLADRFSNGITEGEAYDGTNPDLAHSSTGTAAHERIRAAFSRSDPNP